MHLVGSSEAEARRGLVDLCRDVVLHQLPIGTARVYDLFRQLGNPFACLCGHVLQAGLLQQCPSCS